MNLKEASERMRELFPGCYTMANAEISGSGGRRESRFTVYASAVDEAVSRDGFIASGPNLDALLPLAQMEAERRGLDILAKTAPPQDASAAAEGLTEPPSAPPLALSPADAHQLSTGLAEVAGRDYTEAEHEKAGAKFVGNVAADVLAANEDRTARLYAASDAESDRWRELTPTEINQSMAEGRDNGALNP